MEEGQGVFFFFLWLLFARAPRHWFLENFLLSAPGVQRVFFFLLRSVGRRDLSAGPAQKKNTTQGVFFFLLRPRGKAGDAQAHVHVRALGGRCKKKKHYAGVVFFFFAAAPPGPGWCFLFCCGPARTLTHSLWAGAISARPGWCFFFAAAPPGLFRQ